MNRVMLASLISLSFACAKSPEPPVVEKEQVGPAALDPRAAKPMLDKARKAAEEANARSAEAADAMKNLQ